MNKFFHLFIYIFVHS